MIDTTEIPAPKARMTVVEMICHQLPGRPLPFGIDERFSAEMETDEQPRRFQMLVGEDWLKIDPHGISTESIGEIHIKNNEQTDPQRVPTLEETKEVSARIVQIGAFAKVAVAKVRPGRTARYEPCDSGHLWVRCLSGKARITVTLFPV